MNIGIELIGGKERDINIDVSSLGDLGNYDEKEMDMKLRELITEQYPELTNQIVEIYC